MNKEVFFAKRARLKPTVFTSSDAIAAKLIFDPSTEGSRVGGIIISSTSATQRTVLLQVNAGGVVCRLGHITVPAGAGTNGSVPVVSGLNTGNLPWLERDANGNPFSDFSFAMNLEAKMLTPLVAGEQIDIVVKGANYDE